MKPIKLSQPSFSSKEYNSLKNVIKSGMVSTSSNIVRKFESDICNYLKTKKKCVALNSGTSAIHLALICSDVKQNDEVLMPTLSFIASVNPIIYLKAHPVFFDSEEDHNINIKDVEKFLKEETYFKNGFTINKKTKRKIKALIVVHLWGSPCNFKNLIKICRKKNIKIIEDATESLGASIKIRNQLKYCGTIGDFGCFSFNANKIITTGGGGAIILPNKRMYKYCNYISQQAKNDSFKYIHNELGFNYKLNGILASIGIEQLKKISEFKKKKKKIFQFYKSKFLNTNIKLLENKFENINPAYWLNIVSFKKSNKKFESELRKQMKLKKIEIRKIWKPLHTQKLMKKYQRYKISLANKQYKTSFCIPSCISLNKDDLRVTTNQLINFYENFNTHKKKI